MESMTSPNPAESVFEARRAALWARVATAARALQAQGLKPTLVRVRAALGGGSPNDLAPALKAWREAGPLEGAALPGTPRIPTPIADLAQELWQRASTAAVLELKHGATAETLAARAGEIQGLRTQLSAVREQLERESRAYGELRAQAARHETIARQALARAEHAEVRMRDLLRELGEARQEMAQLRAGLKQRRRPTPPVAAPHKRNAARQNQHPTSRPKRASRARGTSSRTRRSAVQKRRSRRSKDQPKMEPGRLKRGVAFNRTQTTAKGLRRSRHSVTR
jgi:plasmid replication DNA-binding protein KfrA